MYEPFAKNSITERVMFTGIASEPHQAPEEWESVYAHSARAPQSLSETGSARPDPERRPGRPKLHAIR